MPVSAIDQVDGQRRSVGAVTVTIAETNLPVAFTGYVKAYFVCRTGVGASWAGEIGRGAKNVGGTLSFLGGVLNTALATPDPAIVGSTATIDAIGNRVRLRGTGVAAQTINWWGTLELRRMRI